VDQKREAGMWRQRRRRYKMAHKMSDEQMKSITPDDIVRWWTEKEEKKGGKSVGGRPTEATRRASRQGAKPTFAWAGFSGAEIGMTDASGSRPRSSGSDSAGTGGSLWDLSTSGVAQEAQLSSGTGQSFPRQQALRHAPPRGRSEGGG
jgi:hypothetical protein